MKIITLPLFKQAIKKNPLNLHEWAIIHYLKASTRLLWHKNVDETVSSNKSRPWNLSKVTKKSAQYPTKRKISLHTGATTHKHDHKKKSTFNFALLSQDKSQIPDHIPLISFFFHPGNRIIYERTSGAKEAGRWNGGL